MVLKVVYYTMDHKISLFYGFNYNIEPSIIGGIDNLCICSRYINSVKGLKTEKEFNNNLKK